MGLDLIANSVCLIYLNQSCFLAALLLVMHAPQHFANLHFVKLPLRLSMCFASMCFASLLSTLRFLIALRRVCGQLFVDAN